MNGLITSVRLHRPRRPAEPGAVAILIAATHFSRLSLRGAGKTADTAGSRVPVACREAQRILQDSSKGDEGAAFRPRGGDGKQSLDPPV